MVKTQFGKRIKMARLRKNMRQVDLAIALQEYDIDMNQSTLGKIERGERNMYVYELSAFVEILDVSVEWVVNGGELEIS
jgi:transcriptional regulator with XRE-family HTH domain